MSHANHVVVSTTRPRPKPDHAAYCTASGCARWCGRWGPDAVFLCCFHWRRLSKIERATMRRIWRMADLIGDEWWMKCEPLRVRHDRVWSALVRRASLP